MHNNILAAAMPGVVQTILVKEGDLLVPVKF